MADGTTEESEEEVILRPATAVEELFVTLAEDTIKRTIPYLNDFLQKLITLNIALIGAFLVAAKEKLVSMPLGITATLFMFASLLVAIWGVCPRPHILPLYCAKAIEIAECLAVRRKSIFIRTSLILLGLSIAILICGFMFVDPACTKTSPSIKQP